MDNNLALCSVSDVIEVCCVSAGGNARSSRGHEQELIIETNVVYLLTKYVSGTQCRSEYGTSTYRYGCRGGIKPFQGRMRPA